VLPFQNMSGDPEQDYFADGMVDDIITGLSRIKWLFVIASNSTFTYKGRAVDVKQVGRDLGVRYVLEGSVRKAADRVRITGQLIDSATGAHVWAERYDRRSGDIFALQDEIALSVVGAIEPSLRRAEVERVRRKRPDSLDAYDLVLQAQSDVYSGMPERVTKALVLLERALALDPIYPLAHAFAAMCHHCLFLRAGLHEESRAASIRHAQAAILHGQDDALALTFAGFSIGMDGHDHAAAFAALEAALAISPHRRSPISWERHSRMGRRSRAGDRMGRAGDAPQPVRSVGLVRFPLVDTRAFPPRPLRGGSQCARKAVQFNPGHSISYMLLARAREARRRKSHGCLLVAAAVEMPECQRVESGPGPRIERAEAHRPLAPFDRPLGFCGPSENDASHDIGERDEGLMASAASSAANAAA